METNSKIIAFLNKNHFGSGVYFWSFFFIVIISTAVINIERNWIIVLILSLSIVLFSIYQKSVFFGFLVCIPLIIHVQISSIDEEVKKNSKIGDIIVASKEEIYGEIQSISGVRNGTVKITIKTSSGNTFQVISPIQRNIKHGDSIRFTPEKKGEIQPYNTSRGVEGIFSTSRIYPEIRNDKNILEEFKNRLLQWIKKSFPQPEQGLIAGILIGDPSLMSDEMNDTFRKIGLSHITVVSGSNISFLLSSILLILFILPKKIKILIAIGMIILYIGMVGGDPPVLRAGIMGIIGAIGLLLTGKIDSFRILAIACLMLIIVSPLSLVYDAGFQLSFLATLGILVVNKIFPDVNQWRQAVLISIFACIWTIPITIGTFGNFHTWSITANILAGPLVGISMIFSILGGIVSNFWDTGGYWLTFISYVSLSGITSIAEFFAPLPYRWEFNEITKFTLGFTSFGIISGLTYRYQYLQKQSIREISESAKL